MARIFKRGKFWYVDFSYRGRRIIQSTKQRDKRIAELVLKDMEVKIAKGELLGIHDQPKILFRDCAEQYLAYSKANKASQSYVRDLSIFKVHLIPSFGMRYLHELKPVMIEDYKAMRLTKAKPETVNRELACLSNLLNKAIQWGYLIDCPMKGVRYLKERPPRVKYLEANEALRLLENCSEHLKPIVLCALHTGMRKSEILNLKWQNIDFHNRIMHLEKTKNNRRRMIPMSGILSSELRKLPRRGEYVFCNKMGEKFGKIHKSFRTACRRTGINDFRFHDLRHTFASHLTMSGCNIRTVQQLLGHVTIKTTMKYSHLSKEYLEEAVNLLGARLSPKIDTNLEQHETDTSKTQAMEQL